MNIGEELVAGYLQHINKCGFVQTGVYLADAQGEIDVVGINIDKKIVYICEVAIHLETGLQYTKSNLPNNANKLIDKFRKNIEYADKFFNDYEKIFMLWCPIVKNQNQYAKYNQMNDLNIICESIKSKYNVDISMVVNNKFYKCISELRNYALNETKNITNPVIRFLQIEEKLKKHLQKNNINDYVNIINLQDNKSIGSINQDASSKIQYSKYDSNQKNDVYIVGYCFSNYEHDSLYLHMSQDNAFKEAAKSLGVKKNYLKYIRDHFDGHNNNNRRGFWKIPLLPYLKEIKDIYDTKSKQDVINEAKNILNIKQ